MLMPKKWIEHLTHCINNNWHSFDISGLEREVVYRFWIVEKTSKKASLLLRQMKLQEDYPDDWYYWDSC